MGNKKLILMHYPSRVPIQLEFNVPNVGLQRMRRIVLNNMANAPNCLMGGFSRCYYDSPATKKMEELSIHFPNVWKELWRSTHSFFFIVLYLEGPLLKPGEIAKRQAEALRIEEINVQWVLKRDPQRPLRALVYALRKKIRSAIIMKYIISREDCGVNKFYRSQQKGDFSGTLYKIFAVAKYRTPTFNMTPLMAATSAGRIDLMKDLIWAGAVVDCGGNRTWEGEMGSSVRVQPSALDLAVINNNVTAIELLVEHGANKSAPVRNLALASYLHLAAHLHGPTLECLINLGLGVNAVAEAYSTPLKNALTASNTRAISTLISHGADTDTPGLGDKRTALHSIAFNSGHTINNFIDFLIDAGADLEARDSKGQTPLHYAAERTNSVPFLGHLVKCGADAHARSDNLQTALHLAANKNACSSIKFLLERRLDIDAMDMSGRTPLYYSLLACLNHGDKAAIKLLLSEGASVNLGDLSGLPNASDFERALLAIEDLGGAEVRCWASRA